MPSLATPHRYTFAGSLIASDRLLPLVTSQGAEQEPTLRIHAERELGAQPPVEDIGCVSSEPGQALLYYPWTGYIRVTGGARITYNPASEDEAALLDTLLTGAALGVALHQRGHFTLHASAVQIGDEAVALVGGMRAGKTTLACAFQAAGHTILADDMIVFGGSEQVSVWPGVPEVRVDPDVLLNIVRIEPTTLRRIHPSSGRRILPVPTQQVPAPVPLRAIVSLTEGERAPWERLRPPQAFMELLQHAYAPRLLRHDSVTPGHLSQLQRLATQVPVYTLHRPMSLQDVPDTVSWVTERLAQRTTSTPDP